MGNRVILVGGTFVLPEGASVIITDADDKVLVRVRNVVEGSLAVEIVPEVTGRTIHEIDVFNLDLVSSQV